MQANDALVHRGASAERKSGRGADQVSQSKRSTQRDMHWSSKYNKLYRFDEQGTVWMKMEKTTKNREGTHVWWFMTAPSSICLRYSSSSVFLRPLKLNFGNFTE